MSEELKEIRNVLAHEYPLDIEERIENIHLVLKGYMVLKGIYKNLKGINSDVVCT